MTGIRAMALISIAFVVALLGPSYGYVRVVIGATVFFILLSFGFKYWRDVGLIPPEPEIQDVSAQELRYVCSMCGLELKVEIAARDKAPNHCGEAMELVTGPDRTPSQHQK